MDRGLEMAQHPRFAIATDVAVYFCDPQNPWQRGTNQNINGLLHQYFPDGTDLSSYTRHALDHIAPQLNTRIRRKLSAFARKPLYLPKVLHSLVESTQYISILPNPGRGPFG